MNLEKRKRKLKKKIRQAIGKPLVWDREKTYKWVEII